MHKSPCSSLQNQLNCTDTEFWVFILKAFSILVCLWEWGLILISRLFYNTDATDETQGCQDKTDEWDSQRN